MPVFLAKASLDGSENRSEYELGGKSSCGHKSLAPSWNRKANTTTTYNDYNETQGSMMQKLHIIGLFVGAMTLGACGGDNSKDAQEKRMEETAKKYGVDADVTLNEAGEVDKVVINNGFGQYGQGLDLPSGFPKDVVLPSGANILAASAVPGQKDGFSIQALSNDDSAKIAAFLTDKMEQDGWTKTSDDQLTPQMNRLGFEKDARMASFVITENGETNMVQLVTMKKP